MYINTWKLQMYFSVSLTSGYDSCPRVTVPPLWGNSSSLLLLLFCAYIVNKIVYRSLWLWLFVTNSPTSKNLYWNHYLEIFPHHYNFGGESSILEPRSTKELHTSKEDIRNHRYDSCSPDEITTSCIHCWPQHWTKDNSLLFKPYTKETVSKIVSTFTALLITSLSVGVSTVHTNKWQTWSMEISIILIVKSQHCP